MEGTGGGTRGYRGLIVYQRILEFVVLVYKLTATLPNEERFGLVSQMRRASVSVVSNFVEGYLKSSKREKKHFLEMALTSLLEVEAQAEVCLKLEFFKEKEWQELLHKKGEVSFLLYRYRRALP